MTVMTTMRIIQNNQDIFLWRWTVLSTGPQQSIIILLINWSWKWQKIVRNADQILPEPKVTLCVKTNQIQKMFNSASWKQSVITSEKLESGIFCHFCLKDEKQLPSYQNCCRLIDQYVDWKLKEWVIESSINKFPFWYRGGGSRCSKHLTSERFMSPGTPLNTAGCYLTDTDVTPGRIRHRLITVYARIYIQYATYSSRSLSLHFTAAGAISNIQSKLLVMLRWVYFLQLGLHIHTVTAISICMCLFLQHESVHV